MATYCMNCGNSLPDGAAFCDACGTPVRTQGVAQSAPPGYAASGPPPSVAPAPSAAADGSAPGAVVCPACGARALPGEAFCDNCGETLLPPTLYPPPAASEGYAPVGGVPSHSAAHSAPVASPPVPAPAPARHTAQLLVLSAQTPVALSLPASGEFIVGRSDPQSNSYPDVDLGPYGGLDLGVSRRHFRMRAGDQFYIEDLSSVNGTLVNGRRIPPYTLHPLQPGDRLTLGKVELAFSIK